MNDPDLFVKIKNHGFLVKKGQQFLPLETYNGTPPPPPPPRHNTYTIKIYNLPLGIAPEQVEKVLEEHIRQADITDTYTFIETKRSQATYNNTGRPIKQGIWDVTIRMSKPWVKITREALPKRNTNLFGGKRNLKFWLSWPKSDNQESELKRLSENQTQQYTQNQDQTQNTAINLTQHTAVPTNSFGKKSWSDVAKMSGPAASAVDRFTPTFIRKVPLKPMRRNPEKTDSVVKRLEWQLKTSFDHLLKDVSKREKQVDKITQHTLNMVLAEKALLHFQNTKEERTFKYIDLDGELFTKTVSDWVNACNQGKPAEINF